MRPTLSAAAILWRQRDQVEVCLALRSSRMRFFGNVYSFCGGRVDPVDRGLGACALPEDPLQGALRSTMVRELIEELGIDLRDAQAGPAPRELRERTLADSETWSGECPPEFLVGLPSSSLRLVTPDFYPRRFDTHFFVVRTDFDTSPEFLEAELDEAGWDSVEGWLSRWDEGEFFLAPPVVHILRILKGSGPQEWPESLAAAARRIEDPSRVQEIRMEPAVRLFPLRTPTLPPARHTNAYLVGHDPAWLIDPATPFRDERERLERSLADAAANGMRLAGVLLTHHHADHIGAAAAIAERFDVPVLAHGRTIARLGSVIDFERTLEDSEALPLGHRDGLPGELRVLYTPGHADGHLCFFEPRYGGLVAGDMVSTISSILVDPADGDMDEYMASLRRVSGLAVRTVYPAHGPADSRGTRVLSEQIAHRQRREADVLRVASEGPVELDELTRIVYGDVPRPMLGYARKSVESILLGWAARQALVREGSRVRPR